MNHIINSIFFHFWSATDVDECLEAALGNIQLCSVELMCINTEGSYKCDCPDGTVHDTDSQRCTVPGILIISLC